MRITPSSWKFSLLTRGTNINNAGKISNILIRLPSVFFFCGSIWRKYIPTEIEKPTQGNNIKKPHQPIVTKRVKPTTMPIIRGMYLMYSFFKIILRLTLAWEVRAFLRVLLNANVMFQLLIYCKYRIFSRIQYVGVITAFTADTMTPPGYYIL